MHWAGGRSFFRAWSEGWVNSNTIRLGPSSQDIYFKARGSDGYDLDHGCPFWLMQCLKGMILNKTQGLGRCAAQTTERLVQGIA